MNHTDFIHHYFAAEKSGAALFVAVGAVACVVACGLLWRRHAWRGMAWPLLAIGLIQLAVGATVWQRSDAQALAAARQQSRQPVSFRIVEVQRMQGVLERFELTRQATLGLLGLGMALVVMRRQRPFWVAFGTGLVLQASAVLLLDHFAQDRAEQYLMALRAS